jgi:hypothetical protein
MFSSCIVKKKSAKNKWNKEHLKKVFPGFDCNNLNFFPISHRCHKTSRSRKCSTSCYSTHYLAPPALNYAGGRIFYLIKMVTPPLEWLFSLLFVNYIFMMSQSLTIAPAIFAPEVNCKSTKIPITQHKVKRRILLFGWVYNKLRWWMIVNVNDRLALSTVCALFPATLLGPALGLVALGGREEYFYYVISVH